MPQFNENSVNSNYMDAGYPNRQLSHQLDPSGNFFENYTKLTRPVITGYRIQYVRLLWLLELKIRCGRKV